MTKAGSVALAGGGLVVLGLVLIPAFQQAQQGGGPSTIRSLAVAALLYAQDHDDRWPMHTWTDALRPYSRGQAIFDAPAIRAQGLHWGIAMHREVVGQRRDLPMNVLFFETDALGPNVVANLAARRVDGHGRKGSQVIYTDGSTRFVVKGIDPMDGVRQTKP